MPIEKQYQISGRSTKWTYCSIQFNFSQELQLSKGLFACFQYIKGCRKLNSKANKGYFKQEQNQNGLILVRC